MKKLTTPKIDRCIGCHSCSLACARLVHKRISWDTAGIRIRSSGGLTTGFTTNHCLACDPAPCVAACPTKCMYFGDLDDQNSPVSEILKVRKYKTLIPEAGTDPQLYFLI